MTAEDIALSTQVRQDRIKEFTQLLAWIVYNGAALTGVAINDPKKFPALEDAFPSLFEKREQQNWWVAKQRMEAFAATKKGKF